ncbi:hypothetical protein BO86DRAFT_401556 [Aspergillus japonicus CBS 114.51]|uniref:Uncharacterized protein n=1 Tax=Aspergillus japonicus CBS 114.51 TaxID=1448312 RepID=A0A8T8WWE4_ASPJA|nr:hypothetical protein BO86DRAFT_401556 [Aspergillus japonicus CBS 114.51]RAH79742.1 hypothetical protein BO86DRAFT_401556 [Aspergillus japonicus CBS 114.51]
MKPNTFFLYKTLVYKDGIIWVYAFPRCTRNMPPEQRRTAGTGTGGWMVVAAGGQSDRPPPGHVLLLYSHYLSRHGRDDSPTAYTFRASDPQVPGHLPHRGGPMRSLHPVITSGLDSLVLVPKCGEEPEMQPSLPPFFTVALSFAPARGQVQKPSFLQGNLHPPRAAQPPSSRSGSKESRIG